MHLAAQILKMKRRRIAFLHDVWRRLGAAIHKSAENCDFPNLSRWRLRDGTGKLFRLWGRPSRFSL